MHHVGRIFAPFRQRFAGAAPFPPLHALSRRCASTSASSSSCVSATLGLPASAAEYYSAAQEFAARELAPHASAWHAAKHFPVDALRAAAAAGYAGLFVRTSSGGCGLTREEAVPVIEALAGADTSTTAYLTIHNMVAGMIDAYGSEAQRAAWLPPLLSCEALASYCLTEPGSGSDAASLTTRAERTADGGWALTGGKAFISGGSRAQLYAVMARSGGRGAGGISCFLVPAAAADGAPTRGLSFGAQERKMGWHTQPTCAVHFDGVALPAAGGLLGEEGRGFSYAMRALNGGRLSIAACSLGAAAACLDAAAAYTRERRQFGRPLAAFQATRFKLAAAATRLTAARLLVHHAARLLDGGSAAAAAACAMAKKVATDDAFEIVNDCLQLHGGYGYLEEYKMERFLRDVRVHQILEGTNQIMDVLVARSILGDEEK